MASYAVAVRPRLLRWGATDDEVAQPFPGSELISGGERSATMAVTIDAPPSRVWPWLAQMGYGRAGWYSWDRLDNFGQPSAADLHPEWQDIKLRDFLGPREGITSRAWAVAALEPERFLGLRASFDLKGRWFDPVEPRPRFFTDSLWGFLLEPLPDGRTRLIVSGYWAFQPRWLQPLVRVLFLDLEHWIMQTRQFRNLKRLAEQRGDVKTESVAVTQPEPLAATTG
ncbi:MAG TPA: hypothetical protein VFI42_20935 [Thermomicrobiaceae bacterium]|nr:hypothetical protein [Thermomicrobiaceae bacterium]